MQHPHFLVEFAEGCIHYGQKLVTYLMFLPFHFIMYVNIVTVQLSFARLIGAVHFFVVVNKQQTLQNEIACKVCIV